MISGRGGSMMRSGRIRPPRRPVVQSSNVDEFEVCWEKLRDALHAIHTRNAGDLSFEQLYRYSYKIVLKKAGNKLYDRVKDFEEKWFADEILPPIEGLITENLVSTTLEAVPGSSTVERRAMGEKFLKGVRSSWENHNMSMNMIADILMYLERGCIQDHTRPSIYTTTIGLFRDHILKMGLSNGPGCFVYEILNATIIDQINMEREGDVIDKALLRSCVSMLEDLFETDEENQQEQLYLTLFEPKYLDSSRKFYKAECDKLVREGDASAWLRYTQRRLNEEVERCQTTVSPFSLHNITRVLEEELIAKHIGDFFSMEGSGIKAMIDNDRTEDLTILYQLVSRIDSKRVVLRNAVSSRIIELGIEIEKTLNNTDFSIAQQPDAEEAAADGAEKSKSKALGAAAQQTAAAIQWVDDVLRLKDKFDRVWRTCFDEDLILQTALTKSFSDFINSFDRCSEYLSLFIDSNLKRGIKGKTEAEVDSVLEKAITLLRYLSDKDMFETYYQKHLARRLLYAKSESQEVEQDMISRMKGALGNNFTRKFEGMFRDMSTSKETTEQYRDHIRGLGEVDDKRIDLTINVLGGNTWPKNISAQTSWAEDGSRPKIIYPHEIRALQDSFFKFYSINRNGRVLTWLGNMGAADVKCVFPKIPGKTSGPLSKERRYEIHVTTYGMIVLLLFNDLAEDEWLSFEEIEKRTNIPHQDLVNVLTSLAVLKPCRVLLKESQTKELVKTTDRFTFNREFVSKAIKIKAPTVNSGNRVENDEERKETDKNNEETRMYVTDAAIVRIMKQRKELAHSQLITEVIQVLASRFKPDVSLIKKRIEALINRDYLERTELADGSPAYKYVA
ncbi:putative cullulin 3 [Hypoxylon trugodes]|uniref:putative cullulin 3 n=1 Tax=Hypoxylon trugodes TaxID=326681 RepID=UPI00219171A2|nr:putative cullulin 3 [Hypoxylon trugodes]KAI1383589.1 putative cullulin 3 [Hypoxylon trugodes]